MRRGISACVRREHLRIREQSRISLPRWGVARRLRMICVWQGQLGGSEVRDAARPQSPPSHRVKETR